MFNSTTTSQRTNLVFAKLQVDAFVKEVSISVLQAGTRNLSPDFWANEPALLSQLAAVIDNWRDSKVEVHNGSVLS